MLKLLFYFSLFTLSLGQLVSVGKSDGVNLYIFDVAVGLFSLVGFINFILIKKLQIPKYFLFLIPFVLTALVSLIYNKTVLTGGEFLVSFSYLVRLVSYSIAGVVVYNMLLQNILTLNQLKTSVYFSAVFVGIAGLIQLVVLPDFTVLNPELGWDPHQNRLASTFFDPNFVGAFFNIVIAVLLNDLKPGRNSGFRYATFLFLVTCVFLTFSRSAWGMLGIIIFLYGLYRNRQLLFASLLIVFLAYFAVPRVQTRISGITDPADSASYRLESWGNALSLVRDHWFLGVGFNAYKYAQVEAGLLNGDSYFDHSAAGADSSFLFVLVTTGIIGFIFFMVWWSTPFLEEIKKGRRGDLILVSVLAGLFMESLFINSIFYPQILFLLMIVFAKSSLARN